MLECVLCKSSMVSLNIHLEIVLKTILAEESENCSSIKVILVLCRLLGLGLDVEIACISDRTSILNSHFHKTSHVVKLKTHVCVEESLIAFTSAPENIAVAAEFYCSLDSLLDLCC